jgi:hypothetical protein
VKSNEEFCLKVDELVRYSRIPGHLHSAARENAQNKALWLVEDFPFIVRKENVVRETSVWLSDNPEPAEYDFIVNEIYIVSTTLGKYGKYLRGINYQVNIFLTYNILRRQMCQ